LFWDLWYFGFLAFDVGSDPRWVFFARSILASYVFLVGVGLEEDATASLPPALRPKPVAWGFVVEINADGLPLRSLQDPSGEVVPHVSTAVEHDGTLWLGNLGEHHLARLPLRK
jgi:hypothetical protein